MLPWRSSHRRPRNHAKWRSLIGVISLLSILSLADANGTTTTDVPPSPLLSIEDLVKTYGCRGYSQCKLKAGVNRQRPEQMIYAMLEKRTCFCDKECHIFGECCVDEAVDVSANGDHFQSNAANHTTTTESTEEETGDGEVKLFQGIPTSQWGCHKLNLPRNNTQEWAYVVDACPDEYWDENVVTMCSARSLVPDEDYTYLLDLPVVSFLTGVPYLNSYCMACNEEMTLTPPFYPMTLRLACSEEGLREDQIHQEANYTRGERTWLAEGWNCTLEIFDASEVFYGVGGDLDLGRPGRYTRRCLQREESCEDEELANMCASYALYVKIKNQRHGKVYKNPHCAFCHGIKRDELNCYAGLSRIQSTRFKFSYQQLLEIRWDGGAIGSERKQCPPHQVWDAIFKKCAVVRCKSGTVFAAGHCEEYVDQASESYPWNASCNGNSSGSDPGCWENVGEEMKDSAAIHAQVQGYLTVVCMSVSIVCLVLHIATYSALPKLRNLPGRNLLALSWALLVAQVTSLASGTLSSNVEFEAWICIVLAVTIHFFHLSSIFWMNVMSVDVWRTFSSSSSHHHLVGGHDTAKRIHMWYAIYAWGVPTVFILVTLTVDFLPYHTTALEFVRPRYGQSLEGFCWMGNKVGVAIYFSIPTFALLLANAGLFAISVYRIHANQESRRYMRNRAMEEEHLCNERASRAACIDSCPQPPSSEVHRRPFRQSTTTSCISVKDKSRLYLYVKLGMIMGLTWVFAFIAAFTHIRELWYPFIVLNGLQGAFIFVMFDMKRKVLEMLWERMTGKKPDWASSSSRSSGWAFFMSNRRGRRRGKSSGSQTKSTTESSNRKSSGTTGRTSLSTTPALGCGEIADQTVPESGSSVIEEVRLRNMFSTSKNGVVLSPNFFADSERTISYSSLGSEVVKEQGKVERILEEGETSLNSIREEEDPLVTSGERTPRSTMT